MRTVTNIIQDFNSGSPRWRFNPLSGLTPASLSRILDDFNTGYLSEGARVFELLEERDDLLRGVISKRKKSVARHGWAVVTASDVDPADRLEAARQKEALEYFYSNLECESAVDRSVRGGFKLLARQMMDAVGKRFAVHEIVWKAEKEQASGTNRAFVTATFRFVPLGFFENTTGELRFLANPHSLEGVALEPGAWMVTAGEGLMAASAAAWMFKNISLNDWLKSCERNGTPALLGLSADGEGTVERQQFSEALDGLLSLRSAVIGKDNEVRVLDLMGGGHLPYPELVERVDRLLASLWRGADLSTLSRDRGYGASLQEKETCALEEDDTEMITETLNRHVDAWVIRQVFGPEAKQLAKVKVLVSPRECTRDDLLVDEFLLKNGAPLAIEETLQRYGRTLPKPGARIFGSQGEEKQPGGARPSLPANSHEMWNEAAPGDGGSPGPEVSSRGCPRLVAAEHCEAENRAADHHEPENGEPRLANRFELLQGEWLQLSPYGDFPHARGLQRVDRAAAEAMAEKFRSFRGRAGRLFGGAPFYAGHPDLPGASEAADRKAYGWIEDLEARDDGLYGRVKWSEAGLELLRNAHYKYLSPFWEAREIGAENGKRVYQPVALVSAGLTNQPNIPVRPLANEARANGGQAGPRLRLLRPASPECESSGEAPRPIVPIRARPLTEGLGRRTAPSNRADRIADSVRARMKQGLNYDEAWDRVKRENQSWFENP